MCAPGILQDFLRTQNEYTAGGPDKAEKQWLKLQIEMVEKMEKEGAAAMVPSLRGMRPPTKDQRSPRVAQKRLKLTQGAPFRCPELREMLWDWFVDIRFSVRTTLTPKAVLMKARELAKVLMEEQKRLGICRALPDLCGEGSRQWLLRFKRDYGVVFRKPNLRFKCSREKLQARLRAMWCNVFRIRALAQHFLGNDLAQRFWGIDEKPLHFNESGSKGARTLEIAGVEAVSLKQNHAATRQRLTLMTTVSSDAAEATAPERLPFKLLFKAKTDKSTRNLLKPKGLRCTVSHGPKGSYRTEHILSFLRRVLPEWTRERQEVGDYRILMLDVAGSHCAEEVLDLAFERGFIPLFHYGCTTGVCQVNDTDLHGAFERLYCAIEQDAFAQKQLIDPRDISRTAQEVVDDVCATWMGLDHTQASRGHWSVGMAVALDGSEDGEISREAKSCWDALDMFAVRAAVLDEVRQKIAKGEVTGMQDWHLLVKHPDRTGRLAHEGAELECALAEGERPWSDEADAALRAKDVKAVRRLTDEEVAEDPGTSSPTGAPTGGGEVVVAPSAEDSLVVVEEAQDLAKRISDCKGIIKQVQASKLVVPQCLNYLGRMLRQLQRGNRAKTPGAERVNALLRRAIRDAEERDKEALTMARAKAAKRRKKLSKFAKKKAKSLKLALAVSKKKAKMKVTFDAKECGHKGRGKNARKAALEKLNTFSPALPRDLAEEWEHLVKRFAELYPHLESRNTGQRFVDELRGVLQRLGPFYKRPTEWNQDPASKGDKGAWTRYVRSMLRRCPTPDGVLRL